MLKCTYPFCRIMIFQCFLRPSYRIADQLHVKSCPAGDCDTQRNYLDSTSAFPPYLIRGLKHSYNNPPCRMITFQCFLRPSQRIADQLHLKSCTDGDCDTQRNLSHQRFTTLIQHFRCRVFRKCCSPSNYSYVIDNTYWLASRVLSLTL